MSKAPYLLVCLSLFGFGCGSEATSGSAAASTAAAATQKPSAAPAVTTVAVTATATAAPAAPAAQRGLEAGHVVVGYLKDPKDEGQCAVLSAPEAEKAKYDAAKIGEVAKMMKGEVVPACPSENVLGTCKAPFGILVNYSSPKYDKDSAQKDCTKNKGKWIE